MEGQARGGWEGGNKGKEGGREQAMILCRERASAEEGRVEGRRVDEGNERGSAGTTRGMDGTREIGEEGSEWMRD